MGKKLVFLCTGNSCRSQMAEGFARHYGGEDLKVYSAGISPVGINPHAIEVMREAEIDISGQTSDLLKPELLKDADVLVTLCGDAQESCPVVPGTVKKLHWPLEDPARFIGSEEEVMDKFRDVRDDIRRRVYDLLDELKLLY